MLVLAPLGWYSAISLRINLLFSSSQYSLAIFYGFVLVLAYAAIFITPFLKNTWLRLTFAGVGILGFGADLAIRTLTGQTASIDLMQTLWAERAQASGAIEAYAPACLWILPVLMGLAAASALKPPEERGLKFRYALVPILAFSLALELMYVTREDVVSELPSSIAVPALLAMAVSSGVRYRGARQDVDYAGDIKPQFRKIVFIVDESVRGDYLGLNSDRFDNTPVLKTASGKIANFGIATSSTNCSRGARYILRSGLRESQMPDASELGLHQPSMWQYAKKAGFETIHIDGFAAFAGMHSFMNAAEAKAIDKTVLPNQKPYVNIDDVAAARLMEVMAVPQSQFIYVEKNGVHSPYENNVPANFVFEPAGLNKLPKPLTADQRGKVAIYLRAIKWRVDRFFEAILPSLIREDVLVIYTSDHGQAMFEGGYEASHCTQINPNIGEALVPLIAFTGNSEISAKLQAEAVRAHDRASHFEIFPTLLTAMGYDPAWTASKFGPGLLSVPVERKRRFSSTQPLKPRAIWIPVD